MRVLLVNSVCGIGSTGRICTDLAQKFEKEGHEAKIAYGRDANVPEQFRKYAVRIGSDLDVKLHGVRTRILDEHGFGSQKATKQFLKWAEEYNPELLWIHNIHGYYLNVELLFEWIKNRPNMQVRWTLHDCWAFTGHCAYFTMAGCEKWKTHCYECVQKSSYPASSFRDNCKHNFDRKRKAFTGVKNMTLITPSKWLADLVKESYLKDYPVEVHYNTIDTNIFKPTPSDFRTRYGLEEKKIVLGVASVWDERKGLKDFIKLGRLLDDSYVIVLVGLEEKQLKEEQEKYSYSNSTYEADGQVDEELIVRLEGGVVIPSDVSVLYAEVTGNKITKENKSFASFLCISRTNNAKELAEIYTAADVFVNTTYEDNYPTVNLEAKACGTKVITYNTGGCLETLM